MLLSVPMTPVPDCCISILTDIDGSLRVHLPAKRSPSCPFCNKRSLVLVSCTTISVYVNLSKSVLPKGAHQRSATPLKRRRHLICGCKGTPFSETDKTFGIFFSGKDASLPPIHYILYMRVCARRERRRGIPCGKAQGTATMIPCGDEQGTFLHIIVCLHSLQDALFHLLPRNINEHFRHRILLCILEIGEAQHRAIF